MNRRCAALGLAIAMFGSVVAGQITTSDAAQASPNVRLVGLWESQTTSRGGIGSALEFRADGTFVEATTVIVNMHYRVTADQLRVAEQVEALDGAQAHRISLDGEVLQMTEPDGSVIRKERVGKPMSGQPAIVGIWRYRHRTGSEAFERYTEDGRMFFRLPMTSSVGRYELKGEALLLTRPGQPDVAMTVAPTGDGLAHTRDGRVTFYRRDIAGPWYDREHISYKPRLDFTLPKN